METVRTRLVNSWRKAVHELDIQIQGPTMVATGEGEAVACEMIVPNFGSIKGTAVFTEPQEEHALRALQRNGYCCSTFGPVPEGYEASGTEVAEVLADWGWCGPEDRKPSWLP